MRGRSLSQLGFTLLELLAVLVILSLVAATSVRWYFSHADVTLENAAVLLAHDLRAAQHRSLFLSEPSRFLFLPDGAGYLVVDKHGAMAINPQTDEPFRRAYPDDGVFIGVQVLEFDAGADETFLIDPHGTPSEDLSVTLALEDERRTVVLDRKSGTITILGSTSGWEDSDS